MAGRTNFPRTIPFPLLLLNLGNLWDLIRLTPDFHTTVRNESPKCDIQHICSTMRKECRFMKNNTTRLAIYSHYNLVKELRAGWFRFASRIRPVSRRLPTPDLGQLSRQLLQPAVLFKYGRRRNANAKPERQTWTTK